MKILYVRGAADASCNNEIKAYLEKYAETGTQVVVRSPDFGPLNLEYECYQALAAPQILKLVLEAEAEGFDGAVIGCFDDPALYPARELCSRMVVTSLAEASMQLASTLGGRFSVLIGRDKWVPKMRDNAYKYGHRDALASFRSLGLGVQDMQRDHEHTAHVMRREAKAAITEDGAEVIVLGCAMEYGFYQSLQQELCVPVIDSMLAGFKQAEYLVSLKAKTGWYFSKVCQYAGPDMAEYKAWSKPGEES